MSLRIKHNEVEFGVGDVIKVYQKVVEEGKKGRTQIFEGTVIGIRNEGQGRTFVVRRIGTNKIGIEQIFPLFSPNLEKVAVVRRGTMGVRHAKLYYIRGKSKREIEKIYSRSMRKEKAKLESEKKPKRRVSKAKVKRVKKTKTSKRPKRSSKK